MMGRRPLGRPFGWLWAAYAVSAYGSGLGFGAFPLIAILVLHAGAAAVSVLAAAGPAVGAMVAVPLGPWVEFRRKRPVMMAMDLTRCAALLSVPAAFALSRMRFWGSATLATGVFLTYLIPDTLLFLPLFKMFVTFRDWTGIELINHWYVLLVIYPTLTVPFCTWIMIGYFASIPKELDEAAIIDGASWFQTLTRIFIPVALPGIIAATIFAFTASWAQFLYPLVFTTSTDQLVLPVGIITTLIKGDVFNWGQIMTGALLGAAPPLIIYAFLMDYYIAGLTAGATKG